MRTDSWGTWQIFFLGRACSGVERLPILATPGGIAGAPSHPCTGRSPPSGKFIALASLGGHQFPENRSARGQDRTAMIVRAALGLLDPGPWKNGCTGPADG
jgi:hypothetical protein